MKGNRGITKLANVLAERMDAQIGKAMIPTLELGTIVAQLGLKLDSTPDIIIPKSEYMVSEWLTFDLNYPFERTLNEGEEHETESQGKHDHETTTEIAANHAHQVIHIHQGKHRHNVKLPTRLYPIMPGDRVLVAWANRTPVILTKVVRFHNLSTYW